MRDETLVLITYAISKGSGSISINQISNFRVFTVQDWSSEGTCHGSNFSALFLNSGFWAKLSIENYADYNGFPLIYFQFI